MDNLYFIYFLNTLKLPWFRLAQFDNIEITPPPNSTSKAFGKGVIILKDEQNLTFLQFSCLEIIIIINHH